MARARKYQPDRDNPRGEVVMRRVLVTGAAGFIGSHLCGRLAREGFDVVALCRYTSRQDEGNLIHLDPEVRGALDVRFGDLRDRDFVGRAVSGTDTVFHLGASISVPYSFVAPREVVMTNVEGTLNVLAAACDAETPRVLQMSSSEVYGTAQRVPIDEEHPLNPQSPYAASKVGADKLVDSFHAAFDLSTVVVRPFNTYGPRQSLRAVIPTVIGQALDGNTVRLGSTSTRRDFVFVTDTVDGLIRIAQADAAVVAGRTFNLATGSDVAVQDVVDTVAELLGRELTVHADEPERLRPHRSEVLRLIGDASRVVAAVGWEPRTPLREGLAAVIDWMRTTPAPETDRYVV